MPVAMSNEDLLDEFANYLNAGPLELTIKNNVVGVANRLIISTISHACQCK